MWDKPPPGYVDLAQAAKITGYSKQTIVLAAKNGEIAHLPQRAKGSRWFFLPADLRAWRGIPENQPAAS